MRPHRQYFPQFATKENLMAPGASASQLNTAYTPSQTMLRRYSPFKDIPSLYDIYLQAMPPQPQRFGMQVFENGTRDVQMIPMDLPVGPDYVLRPGDSVAIDLWGEVSQQLYRTVNTPGRVALLEVGPVLVAGKTLASEQIADQASASSEVESLYHPLEVEFSTEINLLGGGNNREARLESVYTRVTHISGQLLTDVCRFGQTITNDYGRPHEEVFNNVTGFSDWATDGSFIGYVREEYQYAPSVPPLSLSERQAINQENGLPSSFVPFGAPITAVSRFRLLDSHVGMNVASWQITFGNQSLWWGPDAAGPMMFSDNADPIMMFRINRVSPFKLPSILGLLGPIRGEVFLGQLDGQQIDFGVSTGFLGGFGQMLNPQPFIHGQEVSFKPTRNLDVGLSVTAIFAGQGVRFNTYTLEKSFFSTGNSAPGSLQDPGDRRGGFDFTYRVPGARNLLTLYGDGFADDEIKPLAGAWDKAAWLGGLYFSCLPGLPKLDLRVGGLYSDPPIGGTVSHGFFCINDRYKSGYTADGKLDWLAGDAAWTNHWFTPKDKLEVNFRHQKVSQQFVPFGGTITDGGVRVNFWIRSMLSVSAAVRYEAWNFPVIAPSRRNDVSASIQVSFWPQLHVAQPVTSLEAPGYVNEANKRT